ELALACQDHWPAAVELLRSGALASFLGGLRRHDLAAVAREAARFFDCGAGDRALDLFLRELPATALQPAALAAWPREIDFGRLRVGQDAHGELRLSNEGMGLLHGAVSSNVPWLVLGDAGAPSKLFSALNDVRIPVQVLGRALRAGLQVQSARL